MSRWLVAALLVFGIIGCKETASVKYCVKVVAIAMSYNNVSGNYSIKVIGEGDRVFSIGREERDLFSAQTRVKQLEERIGKMWCGY